MAKGKKAAVKAANGASESKPAEVAAAPAEKPKAPAKKVTKRRRQARPAAKKAKGKKAASAKAKPARKPRHSRFGKRYTPAERAKILAAAKREGLTGAQASNKFGISTLTFYTWRKTAGADKPRGGKVRGEARAARVRGSATGAIKLTELVRREVRAQIDVMLPSILQSEVANLLGGSPGRRSRRR